MAAARRRSSCPRTTCAVVSDSHCFMAAQQVLFRVSTCSANSGAGGPAEDGKDTDQNDGHGADEDSGQKQFVQVV